MSDHPKINSCENCGGTGFVEESSFCYCMSQLEGGGYCQCDTSYEETCPVCLGAEDGTVMIELTSE